MKLTGLLVTIFGWLVAVGGIVITGSLVGRFVFAVIGIAICIFGILGLLNTAHQKTAVWKQ
ncbi:MAG: hypothetical protein ACRD2G_08425 [Terriglobia bacterium]